MGKNYYQHHDRQDQLIKRFNWGETISDLDQDYETLSLIKEDLEDLEHKIQEKRKSIPAAILDLYDQERVAQRLSAS